MINPHGRLVSPRLSRRSHPDCRATSRNRPGANDGEKCILNGVVDAQTAEGDAARLGVVHPPSI
jgi:hypothetical protein